MANEILARQHRPTQNTPENRSRMPLRAFSRPRLAGQLRELRDGPHRSTKASQWHEDLARGLRRERAQAAWEQFVLMEAEQRELKLQKERQIV